ncbi:phospholipase A2 inhibitor and Ly6/PLAUR domain-containing protein-like [Podarcis raffonei]|uniref:phospholipase A2 inhibitor and Ly6/PLAUR domain-containing protein-like n=1 Tax=Podarcis raffonei TaxID=65483 RepID=UPI00232996C3|nr:phospholipase A2 inhibitor and Ly6/PLAUR domain-containing protein-like [Podarcis raffonei]
MQAALGLLLFSVLLAGASSLECEVCSSNARTCSGQKVTCEDKNEVCQRLVTEVSGTFRVEKKCEKKATCESLKNQLGKSAPGQFTGVVNEIVCNKAPSPYASLLLALSGLLLKNVLF